MRVYLGSDHAGFELKGLLAARLGETGHEVFDIGPHRYDPEDDYPAYCLATAAAVVSDAGSLGVVIGGSGNGEQIAANKVLGIRAALAWSTETARLSRMHNDAQVVSIGARMHSLPEAAEIVDAFLGATFTREERHERRLSMVIRYEDHGELPPIPASEG